MAHTFQLRQTSGSLPPNAFEFWSEVTRRRDFVRSHGRVTLFVRAAKGKSVRESRKKPTH
jgi:hypothetical protein